jgi:hypothetical protein
MRPLTPFGDFLSELVQSIIKRVLEHIRYSPAIRRILRWAGATWIVFLVGLSLQPRRWRATNQGTSGHCFLHLLLFGFAASFPLLLSKNLFQSSARALCVLALAGAIELAQGQVYRYHTEWRDVLADGLGILLAFVVITLVRNWNNREQY